MLILPAIDLIGGKCVRLSQGDYSKETDYGLDPLEVAKSFEADGAEWIHIVDLEGARTGVPVHLAVIEAICAKTSLRVECGGGIRSIAIAREFLQRGVARVVVGTKVATDANLAREFFETLGEQCVAGVDVKDGRVAVSGWMETVDSTLSEAVTQMERLGARRLIVTDISRDGMLKGPNMALLEDVLSAVTIPVIQSGGISSIDDVFALKEMKQRCEGVIIGKAIYENHISLPAAIQTAAT